MARAIRWWMLGAWMGVAVLAGGCGGRAGAAGPRIPAAIHRIRHVIVVMQENRSFDSYFGTFPGADGIPMHDGRPTVCLADPRGDRCVRPYHDRSLVDAGGPHNVGNARADIDGGAMDGFVRQAVFARTVGCLRQVLDPSCSINVRRPDVMGYHDAHEIPNYWTWAHRYVLQDHLFESNLGWSLPSHLALVSGWSAFCSSPTDPMTCHTDLTGRHPPPLQDGGTYYPWTDLTYLLASHGISWGYYVTKGDEPDCGDDAIDCRFVPQDAHTPGIWNPLPHFGDVQSDGQGGDVAPAGRFFREARSGTLPNVSWIVPDFRHSEHPPASIADGQAWVTRIVDAVMRSPDWDSSAIFIAWDDWGGFYDHVEPPTADGQSYGLRVPGILISPWARRGVIDHQTLSFDAYLRFIEDDFLGGARIDPATDGRPDSRPAVRETAPILGSLDREFDFSQAPRPPQPLPLRPRPSRSHPARAAAGRTS